MLGCAFSVFGTDIHAMRNHKKNHGERNAPDWGSTSTFDDNWIQYRFGRLAFGTFLETSDLWVAPRQCLLLPHHPSLAPLLEESGLLGEVPPPSKHVMAFCCEWWWNSELRPHTILHPQYKGIYTWFTIHESDSECDFLCWWICYSCCFTESVIYIYIYIFTYEHMFNYMFALFFIDIYFYKYIFAFYV